MTARPHHPLDVKPLLAKAAAAKGAILEATDVLRELDDLFDGYAKLWQDVPKGNTSPAGLLRAAHSINRECDVLALKSLERFMSVLALVEQALTNKPCVIFVCAGCGATVRITEKHAAEIEGKKPICIACHGDLEACPS